MKLTERSYELTSGDLRLEAALHEGDGDLAAVVLHPHPQYGGDMHNHVVMAACGVFAELGATTLRFNFRGTGRSDGAYDQGRGEADDARAACAALRELRSNATLLLAGYSFGAIVAANAAVAVKPRALALISPPFGMAQIPALEDSVPTLLITGDRDQIAPPDTLRTLESPHRTIVVVPGVDHGWWPGLEQLSDALRDFVTTALCGQIAS